MNLPLPRDGDEPRTPCRLAPGEVHVWVARLAGEGDLPRLERYRRMFDERETQRLDRLRTPALKAQFLLTRALCREALSLCAEVEPQDWRFELDPRGKPAIAAPRLSPPLRFNLSNTPTVVACAVAVDAEVGIDIEQWTRPDESLPITPQIFSAAELQALRSGDAPARRRLFYELWTLKEAYVKACGQGLSTNLDQVSFDPRATPIGATFGPALVRHAGAWQFEQVDFGPDHLLALAIATRGSARARVTVREFDLAGLAAS